MSLTSLELFKAHVRVDFDNEDAYLQHLLDSAEAWVARSVRRDLHELSNGTEALPPDVTHAVLLVAAHWYAHPEAVDSNNLSEMPYTLSAILKPLTKLTK